MRLHYLWIFEIFCEIIKLEVKIILKCFLNAQIIYLIMCIFICIFLIVSENCNPEYSCGGLYFHRVPGSVSEVFRKWEIWVGFASFLKIQIKKNMDIFIAKKLLG